MLRLIGLSDKELKALSNGFKQFKNIMGQAWENIKKFANSDIGQGLITVAKWVAIVAAAFAFLPIVVFAAIAVLTTYIIARWGIITEFVGSKWQIMVNFLTDAWNGGMGKIDSVMQWFRDNTKGVVAVLLPILGLFTPLLLEIAASALATGLLNITQVTTANLPLVVR
jgi:phage-related minor tail protein